MKFEITEVQANKILAALGETPAKISFEAICVLKSLKAIKNNDEPKKEESEEC